MGESYDDEAGAGKSSEGDKAEESEDGAFEAGHTRGWEERETLNCIDRNYRTRTNTGFRNEIGDKK